VGGGKGLKKVGKWGEKWVVRVRRVQHTPRQTVKWGQCNAKREARRVIYISMHNNYEQ